MPKRQAVRAIRTQSTDKNFNMQLQTKLLE